MKPSPRYRDGSPLRWLPTAVAAGSLLLAGCTGDDGDDGLDAPIPPTSDELARGDDAPGVVLQVMKLGGASGAGGNFQVGDRISVTFTARKDDGSDWQPSEFDRGRILVSGPTFNYQRVLAEQSDLFAAAVENADGSLTYTFADPIPATYLPPFNDTASFGPLDGELAGQPLLAGTYTVGLYATWDYTVEGESFRDQGDVSAEFLLGDALALAPREVVKLDNCNRCHVELQAHGGSRRDVRLCLLCHTAGAEDRNSPAAAGGTPGASIEFATMIHKIHNGAHLPSVLGVGVNPDGSRDYTAPATPYQLVGRNDTIIDFSDVAFPVWPNLTIAMPRDAGYSALSTSNALGRNERTIEDTIRTGVAGCFVCHGDPDDAGPLVAPAQGDVAYSQPSRAACGSCHDDVDWTRPYMANTMTMPEQNDDSACTLCHSAAGEVLSVPETHRHPLLDPTFNPGLNFEISEVLEAGVNDGDGTLDPGEQLQFMLHVTDDSGAEVDPSSYNSPSLGISGPTSNSNLVQFITFPKAMLTGPQPYSVQAPQRVWLEHVGQASAAADLFATDRTPHWNATGALTEVRVGTLTPGGGNSALAEAVPAGRNFIDLNGATGFARDEYIVIDRGDPQREEYLRVQFAEGNRLWFSSLTSASYPPGPVFAHDALAPVEEVSLALLVEGVDYTLATATGEIMEAGDFGDGNAVVVTYTTDFVLPDTYPGAINDSPDLDETAGQWTGKSLLDGTYSLVIYGTRSLSLTLHGETNSYNGTSLSARRDFLVGSATQEEPYDLISSAENCYSCHQDLYFHGGGRRGFDACNVCHGTAGSEDRPRYVAANAPATTGVSVNFRAMIHKIHMGEELANASTYTVVGFGGAPYPDNYTAHTYGEVVFPAFAGGVMHCDKCHGTSDSWMEPAPRNHPAEQGRPTLVWSAACGSCHDSDSALAHIEIMTSGSGHESCATCHSLDDELNVPLVHKTR